jgi:hypothetical protein
MPKQALWFVLLLVIALVIAIRRSRNMRDFTF